MSLHRHAGLDPASITHRDEWIPAFAEMTKKCNFRLFTEPSRLIFDFIRKYRTDAG